MATLAGWNTLTTEFDSACVKTLALENYSKILTGVTVPSQVFNDVLKISLESVDMDIDIKEGSKATLRAIKEGTVKAIKYLVTLIKKMTEYIKAFLVRFTGNIALVRRAHTRMSVRLGKLGSPVVTSKVMVKGVANLSVDGKFVGSSIGKLKDIHAVTDYLINAYPEFIVAYTRKSSREVLNILDKSNVTGKDVLTAYVNAYTTLFKEPPGSTTMSGDDGYLKHGVVLPSNKALIFSDGNQLLTQLNSGQQSPESFISKSMTVSFSELSLNIPDDSEKEIDVPSIRELKALSDQISNILNVAENSQKSIKEFERVKVVVDDAIRQIGDDSIKTPMKSLALVTLGQMSKKLSEPVGNFTHWLAITLNVYVNLLNLFINHYVEEGN